MGWEKIDELIREQRQRDYSYQASVIGLNGVPDIRKDPMQAYRYCLKRRETLIKSHKQRPLIRLWDKNMKYIGRVTAEKNVDWEELMYASGASKILMQRNNWLGDFLVKDVRAEEDLHITIDPRPTKRSWEERWGGKVMSAHVRRTEDGVHEIELGCISNWEHWKHICFRANPVFPPEVQVPKIFIIPGNTRTITSFTGMLNLAAEYSPFVSIPANIFNPAHWILPSTAHVGDASNIPGFTFNINPLDWPVQMAYVNGFLDQSRFSFITSRWSMADVATEPIHKDAGCFIRAYTWLEEDKTSPHRELVTLVGESNARPTRNCVVLSCEDKSGVTGPTGTALDGIIDLFAATADDGITEILFPVDADGDGVTDPLFRKWLGVAPKKPKVVFRDNDLSGIKSAERIQHKAQARTINIGGKSPGWVNQLQTFGIRYGLAQLSAVISYGFGAYQQVGTPGLDNLYQGQLDDTLLAFQKYTDPKRVWDMGLYALIDHMEQAGGSAYTLSGQLQLRMGHWKTRPYTGFKTSIHNGHPWLVWDDYTLGDRVLFELEQIFFTDQVAGIKAGYSETDPLHYEISVGTDDEREDPFARAVRGLQAVWSIVGMVLGDGGGTF
jgi:hypothetical protein